MNRTLALPVIFVALVACTDPPFDEASAAARARREVSRSTLVQNQGDLELLPLSEPPEPPEPTVVERELLNNGAVADRAAWPALFVSRSGNRPHCTSTLIGPQALLTAAHCVGNGRTVRIRFLGNTEQGTCTHAPDFAANHTADWALCRMEREIRGIPYERINYQAETLRLGGELLLTGFGCSGPNPPDGFLRTGPSVIAALPQADRNYIDMSGGVVLCFGDSGGPAFLLAGEDGPRRLAAVNSRASSLASVTTSSARRFFRDWSATNSVRICGLPPEPQGCRE